MAAKGKKKDGDTPHISGQANEPLSGLPHTLTIEQAAKEICANLEDGLTSAEAKIRLEKYGPNELDDGPGVQPVKILIRQVANAMTLVKRTTLL
jgi:P-type Na+/K+ transporter